MTSKISARQISVDNCILDMEDSPCLRCCSSDHLQNECPLLSSNALPQKCLICGSCQHASSVHEVNDFEQRHDIIQLMGYEAFKDWFTDLDFRNWWQVNGRIGVPLYKIYPYKRKEKREWKEWKNYAPSLHKDKNYICQQNLLFPNSLIDLSGRYRPIVYIPYSPILSTKPKNIPSTPKTVKLKPPPNNFSDFIDMQLDLANDSIKTSDPTIPLKWRQNNRVVSIAIGIPDVSTNEVMAHFESYFLRIDVERKKSNWEYFLEIKLENCMNLLSYKVTHEHIEVKMRKNHNDEAAAGGFWKTLYKIA